MRLAVFALIFASSASTTFAQPAQTYPEITQPQAVVCGASLALHGVEAERITPDAMSKARPVTRLVFNEDETNRIKGALTGYAAMVPTFAYNGEWLGEDGSVHRVVCVYRRSMVGLVVAKSEDLGPVTRNK